MGKIVLLDDLTINKIAAGEVIERPASCVKEMCENSIDAGAKNITVEIKNGGISLIKIIDDGSGISEDDMEIAFERHATSKIRSADDLNKVTTMGFRGEALASIAAISNVEMISKRPEDEVGHKIVVEGGKVIEKCECGAQNGTVITVKNLFFNTPVRYKFLKKDFTEAGYIEDAITHLALINKNVSIKLINNGKTVIQTNGNGDIKSLIYSIYGKDVADNISEIDYTYEDIKVTGVVGNTSIARSNRNGQIFFVNRRFVKDKTLTSSVDQAYRELLPVGKYGFVILNLEIDTSKVDCNVHPAKLEVRFEEEQKVFKAVYHAIKSKNDGIINSSPKAPEIKEQVTFEEKIEDNKEEKNETFEKEEFKPREGTFSGFFKMFKNKKEDEEENTLIKDIFEAKKNGKLAWNEFEDSKNDEIIDNSPKASEIIEKNVFEEKREQEIIENKDEEVKKNDLIVENELESLKDKANQILKQVHEKENGVQKNEVKEVRLGNTIISSDTKESAYDVNDLMNSIKQETMKLDTTKMISSNDSKTEIIDSLKKVELENNRETVAIDTENVRKEATVENETKFEENGGNEIAERLLEQKVNSNMEETQFIDTNKVRNELYNKKENVEEKIPNDFANMYKKVFGTDVSTVRKDKEEKNAKLDFSSNIQIADNIENETIFNEEIKSVPSIKYRFIGTIFDTYAIIEVKDEMYMIEKNAAEERLMYEIVKKNYYDDSIDDSVQLLLADIITLNPKEMSIARDLEEMFNKVGFEFDEFGEGTLKLIKVPSWAESLNTKKLFLEILREMDTVAVTAQKEKEYKFIATVSAKFVEISDTKLTDKELEDLIRRLLKLESPFMYPNGRLTAVKITRSNMEKKFSRR